MSRRNLAQNLVRLLAQDLAERDALVWHDLDQPTQNEYRHEAADLLDWTQAMLRLVGSDAAIRISPWLDPLPEWVNAGG